MILYQHRIYRKDLRANPHALYLFGDNLRRTGLGGQAKEMRGEPNAVGIATKIAPGTHPEDFFSDDNFWNHAKQIDADFERVGLAALTGTPIIVPLDGLGTGLSRMPDLCPRLYAHVNAHLERLGAKR